MSDMMPISASRVLEVFRYDRSTGKFYWLVNPGIKNVIGKEAGMLAHHGKRVISLDGRRYNAEKLVWLLEHGELPGGRIGYLDGCPGNTAISNLMLLRRERFDKQKISQEELESLLDYSPGNGKFFWKRRPIESFMTPQGWTHWEARYAGREAGYVDPKGYVSIRIKKRLYKAHRLAWLYVHKQWPSGVIDHMNGDPADNRIGNLRDVPQRVNAQNKREPSAGNKVGILGVVFSKEARKYAAYIGVNGKSKALGYFDTAEAAGQAYLTAKRKHHEGCTI